MKIFPAFFLVLIMACSNVSGSGDLGLGTASASPPPESRQATVVERLLDFEAPKEKGQLLARYQYDTASHSIGGMPACDTNCHYPCPCSVPIVPRAFAIDRKRRHWITDVAKGRVAVFAPNGKFLFQVRPPGNNYENRDIQALGKEILVTRPTPRFLPRIIRIRERKFIDITGFRVDGKRYFGGEQLWIAPTEPRAVTFLHERVGSDTCCLGFAALVFDKEGTTAQQVPGLNYGDDGWLVEEQSSDGGTIHYRADTLEPWDVAIQFKLRMVHQGEEKLLKPIVAWEVAVSAEGTVHVLLAAAPDRSTAPQRDGYWYLAISPNGEVGDPVRLAAPDPRNSNLPNPTYQIRRLSLDATGNPVVMWAGPQATTIRRIPI